MLVGVVATIAAPNPPADTPPATFASAVIDPVRDLAARHGALLLLVLLFIVLFKVPDYMASAMNDPMLIDAGFSKEEIAFWGLGVGTAVTIPGVLAGGLIASSIGLGRALVVFGVAQAVSNAGYLLLAGVGANVPVMIGVISVEYFCSGLVAAGFVAFLMSQCNHRFSATQYALLTSVMGLSSAFAKAPTGYIVQETSYTTFFAFTILAALPGMLLLVPLLPHLKRIEVTIASTSPSA
jgi:PAT family beta-lactamase induction signal transducer AmpG